MSRVTTHFGRRQFLGQAFAALSTPVWPALAQPRRSNDPGGQEKFLTPAAEQAIRRGLSFLKSRQRENGSIGEGRYGGNVAIVGLAGLAFMANGSTPGRGPYGLQVQRCVAYIIRNTQEDGFITARDSEGHGRMYGHGFACLFLAEAYGMSLDLTTREKLSQAVNLIVNSQNDEGGWRYEPNKHEADTSVTVCQIMALRAARDAGISVPKETIDRCTAYVKRSQNADGGFMYMLNQPGDSRFPRSAAGIVALYNAGIYEGDEIDKGLNYLMQHVPAADEQETGYYFYGQYYAAQALWHEQGERWKRWFPAIRDVLLARQQADGSWSDQIGAEYGTAMACMILQMPNNYLPILQH